MPVDPALAKALADGTYVVDARAVAGAILGRDSERTRALSRVLESAQRDGLAGAVEQDEAAAGADLA